MRQHADLAAVVGFMREHISNHGSTRGPRAGPTVAHELPDATLRTGESFGEHLGAALRTFGKRRARLLLRTAGTIKLRRQLEMRRGKSQPLATNIVDVSEDGSDGARAAAWRFGVPSSRVEMLKDELVHCVVDREGFQQNVAELSLDFV